MTRQCAPHSKRGFFFESVGLKVIPLKSPAEFLGYKIPDTSCCIVLDVRMPQMSGLGLQEELAKAEVHVPVLFLTAHGQAIKMAVAAIESGGSRFSRQAVSHTGLAPTPSLPL